MRLKRRQEFLPVPALAAHQARLRKAGISETVFAVAAVAVFKAAPRMPSATKAEVVLQVLATEPDVIGPARAIAAEYGVSATAVVSSAIHDLMVANPNAESLEEFKSYAR